MTTDIAINTADPVKARMEPSKKQPSNVGIVIAHDLFGIDKDIEDRIEHWSAMGYMVVVPDLFSLGQETAPLGPGDVDAPETIKAAADTFNVEQGLKDIAGAIAFARQQGCHGVGVLGFGLGGLLAALAAAKTDCDAAIGYSPIGVEKHPDGISIGAKTETPLSLYYAGEDALVGEGVRDEIALAFAGQQNARVFTHPHVRRHFYRWDSRERDRCALTLAEHRAGEFFYMNLTLKHWQTRPAPLAASA